MNGACWNFHKATDNQHHLAKSRRLNVRFGLLSSTAKRLAPSAYLMPVWPPALRLSASFFLICFCLEPLMHCLCASGGLPGGHPFPCTGLGLGPPHFTVSNQPGREPKPGHSQGSLSNVTSHETNLPACFALQGVIPCSLTRAPHKTLPTDNTLSNNSFPYALQERGWPDFDNCQFHLRYSRLYQTNSLSGILTDSLLVVKRQLSGANERIRLSNISLSIQRH